MIVRKGQVSRTVFLDEWMDGVRECAGHTLSQLRRHVRCVMDCSITGLASTHGLVHRHDTLSVIGP